MAKFVSIIFVGRCPTLMYCLKGFQPIAMNLTQNISLNIL
jgi:hypothetical protein